MVLLQSNARRADFMCPDFHLSSVDDREYSRDDFASSQALLVAFICAHCPYVKAIEDRLIALRRRYSVAQLAMVGICSNDAKSYPADAKSELYKLWRAKNYDFPYLVDEKQQTAQSFDAVCTPDLFLFDQQRQLYYHGRLDDNWQNEQLVSKHELADAIDGIIHHQPAPVTQNPSMGCSIKWLK